ncbi:MAG: hypothetical protein FJ279_23185, partial [Planctomycetes bacterium]|nr:hypothetical protein [Planctomycetota bacterium]
MFRPDPVLGLVVALVAGVEAAEMRWQSVGLASSGWMRSICADPRNENVLWAVADMGGGILKTDNGGRSWRDVMENAIRDTNQGTFANIFIHPKGLLFVGYRSSFIRSSDDGRTWETTDAKLEIDPTWMEFQEARPNLVYAVNNLGTVFRSADTGKTWQTAFQEPQKAELEKRREFRVPGYFAKIKAMATEGAPGYVLYRNHPHFGVTTSRDEGKTWSECNSGLPHREVIGLDTYCAEKTKERLLFALLQAKLNAQGNGWVGGVYVSSDGGRSWTERNKGIVTHVPPQFLAKHLPEFNSLVAAKKVRGLLYVLGGRLGDRQVALLRSEDAGQNWVCLHTNYVNVNTDGTPREICRIPYPNMLSLAQSNPDILYCFASSPMLRFEQRGRIARQIEYQPINFETGKYRWLGVSHVCTKGVAADPAQDFVHTINHDVGYNRVDLKEGVVDFRSVRHSPWSQGNAILVDPENPGTVFFGGSELSSYKDNPKNGAIFKSSDYGQTFRSTRDQQDSGLPSGFIFDLALDLTSPKERRRVYASVGGAGVFASEDGGETWRSVHGNLPPVSVKTSELSVQRLHVD